MKNTFVMHFDDDNYKTEPPELFLGLMAALRIKSDALLEDVMQYLLNIFWSDDNCLSVVWMPNTPKSVTNAVSSYFAAHGVHVSHRRCDLRYEDNEE